MVKRNALGRGLGALIDDAEKMTFLVTATGFGDASAFVGFVNADNSGELEVFQDAGRTNRTERYQWDKDGNGTWWEYLNGAETDSGEWN